MFEINKNIFLLVMIFISSIIKSSEVQEIVLTSQFSENSLKSKELDCIDENELSNRNNAAQSSAQNAPLTRCQRIVFNYDSDSEVEATRLLLGRLLAQEDESSGQDDELFTLDDDLPDEEEFTNLGMRCLSTPVNEFEFVHTHSFTQEEIVLLPLVKLKMHNS